jgi:predicted AAA+ superfamily ATPase
LKTQWIRIWKDSLYNFYEYLHNIYFIEPLNNYWAKIKWLKKNYLIDVSFANLIWNEDFWQRFENFIFLELRKTHSKIYFLNRKYEIDFFIPNENKYIQVVYTLTFENLERETKNLLKQDWEKILIYFDKENWIIVPKKIKLISFDEFLNL